MRSYKIKSKRMKILEIAVKDLQHFLNVPLYQAFKTIPLTPERMLSQINNPRARADDIVLIVALTDENNLAGFVGMVPDEGHSADGSFRFAWNSCWWVDPVYGKGIALKLFYKSIQAWEGQYMITDLTEYTRNIVKKTGLFIFTKPKKGIYLKIRSDFSLKAKVNSKIWCIMQIFLALSDTLINSIEKQRLSWWQKKNALADITVQYISHFEPTDINLIQRLNKDELCRRGNAEFEWINSFPWLTCEIQSEWKGRFYPFSWLCRQFKTEFIRILQDNEIIGLAMLTCRDGVYKIPYAYFIRNAESKCFKALCHFLIERQAGGFLTFREELAGYMIDSQFPVLRKKQVLKDLAFSKSLSHYHPEMYMLQDGDGDVVFT